MSLARLEPHKESVPDAIRAFELYFFKIREFNVRVEGQLGDLRGRLLLRPASRRWFDALLPDEAVSKAFHCWRRWVRSCAVIPWAAK
jgi:hypothetical protein